jgi:hypothetical protein
LCSGPLAFRPICGIENTLLDRLDVELRLF